jgi:energy-coupling factor transporter ATP-binding protein EcfA2
LAHKEKLEARYTDIETLHKNMIWVNKANQFNKQSYKTQSTNTEKRLSKEYFNADYINAFNDECENLNGKFGIEIDSKSSDAQSNRQLFLKGNDPSSILSEGEQKVIALADFIAESNITTINKGVILDDPVTSLDEKRKNMIAKRLVSISENKQVIIFTHDLVFVSSLINNATDLNVENVCHWIESTEEEKGIVYLENTPSYDKKYRNAKPVDDFYKLAKDAGPEEREKHIRSGFAALRTCYETFVIYDVFKNIVQRFNDRVSVMSLSSVCFDDDIVKETIVNFEKCCTYMEGHTHSDKYSANKPDAKILFTEMEAYNALKKKYKQVRKDNGFKN